MTEEYLLGTNDEELERLRFQHEVWRTETERLWSLANFREGQTLLDLAAGPGLATVDLAGIVGASGRVVALDASPKYTDLLRRHVADTGIANIEVRTGDVYECDYGSACFDGVFIRWLFCFLTDHESIVKKSATALKPGGTLVAFDYFNYLAVDLEPSGDRFRYVFKRIQQSFVDAGGDLYVGGKLPLLLKNNDFVVEEIVPVCRAARPGSDVWAWVTRFLQTYLPGLVDKGYISQRELEEFRNEWQERETDGVSFFFSPPMLGIVATRK